MRKLVLAEIVQHVAPQQDDLVADRRIERQHVHHRLGELELHRLEPQERPWHVHQRKTLHL